MKHETITCTLEINSSLRGSWGAWLDSRFSNNTGTTVAVKDRWSSRSLKGFQLPAAKVASHYLQLKAKLPRDILQSEVEIGKLRWLKEQIVCRVLPFTLEGHGNFEQTSLHCFQCSSAYRGPGLQLYYTYIQCISCSWLANFLTLPLEHTSHTMTTPWQWTRQKTSEQNCKDHDVQSSLLGWFLRLA